MEYCPDCVVPMKKDSRKIGRYSVWLVCPKCGLRKRPENERMNFINAEDKRDAEKEFKRRLDLENEESDN